MGAASRRAKRAARAAQAVAPPANVVHLDELRPHRGPPTAKRAYEGASNGRLSQGWLASSSSADTEIWSAARTLRDRSRELVRNNPHAATHVYALNS